MSTSDGPNAPALRERHTRHENHKESTASANGKLSADPQEPTVNKEKKTFGRTPNGTGS
jgi:hypothetical protein